MAAEIIEFPERGRDRLVSSIARLETIVGEVERIVADEPEAGVDRLLAIMERMGDQLVDLASLVLDEGVEAAGSEGLHILVRQDRGKPG